MENKDIQPKPTVFVVGDSTLSAFDDDYFLSRQGYGTQLSRYLRSDVSVVNLALSGRSSKSFLTEPSYQTLRDGLRNGDFLIIGFGHNDEKPETARYTNPNGDPDDPSAFVHYLREYYVRPALEAGAVPILCTPIVRRSPMGRYEGHFVHVTETNGLFTGGDYPQAIRDLGNALGLTVLDLTEATKRWYETLGIAGTLAMHARVTDDVATVDNSHLNAVGAQAVAYWWAKCLSNTNNPLKTHLKKRLFAPKELLRLSAKTEKTSISKVEKRFPDGRTKAFNFSYDDGVVQDERFVEMLNRHGLMGTFHLNSQLMLDRFVWTHESGMVVRRLTKEQAVRIYAGHEVAAHSLTHPYITKISEDRAMSEMTEDKANLEAWFQRPIRGFGYPFDAHSPMTVRCTKKAGFIYARTSELTGHYGHERDPFQWKASIFHLDPGLDEFVEGFLRTKEELAVLQIVGHTYEFDVFSLWERMEALCRRIASHAEIWKTSTIELVEYLKAMDQTAIRNARIVNDSAVELWFEAGGKVFSVPPKSVFVVQ